MNAKEIHFSRHKNQQVSIGMLRASFSKTNHFVRMLLIDIAAPIHTRLMVATHWI